MKKMMLAAASAAALISSGVANAAVTVAGASPGVSTSVFTSGDTTTIDYSANALNMGPFSGFIDIMNTLDGIYTVTFGTSTATVDFSTVTFAGNNLNLDVDDGTREQYGLSNLYLTDGTWRLYAEGSNSGETGALAGTFTITRAIPEPATWAMMLFGFGAVGFAMRRNRRPALAQLA